MSYYSLNYGFPAEGSSRSEQSVSRRSVSEIRNTNEGSGGVATNNGNTSSGLVKISQRPSKSCTECIRRKTRCNKQIPCDLCTKRNVPHLCRLDSQFAPAGSNASHPGSRSNSITPIQVTHPHSHSHTSGASLASVTASEIDTLRAQMFAEIDSLRRRINSLEKQSGKASTRRDDEMASGSSILENGQRPGAGTEKKEKDIRRVKDDAVEAEDAATTLEFFALGLDRRMGAGSGAVNADEVDQDLEQSRPPTSGTGNSIAHLPSKAKPITAATSHILSELPPDRIYPDNITDALLPRQHVHQILQHAETHVLWQHCCVFFPRFWIEVDAFWQVLDGSSRSSSQGDHEEGSSTANGRGWNRVEPTWVALLYVIMGIAIHQMTEEHVKDCGLSEADRLILPNALVSAAEDALYLGHFLSRPTIWTVQAIAILTLCGHNVCDSDLLSSLLAVGIKTAQTLNLHSLSKASKALNLSSSSFSQSSIEGSGGNEVNKVVEVELGKRLWWALTQEDWFAIPFRGVWSIHRDHFDTPIPHNCYDADLLRGLWIDRPKSTITVSLKQHFSSQISGVIESFFRRLKASPASPFELAQESANKIRSLLAALPPTLQAGHTPLPGSTSTPDDPLSEPPWAQTLRHYLQISATHKILVIYRAFLSHIPNYPTSTHHHQQMNQIHIREKEKEKEKSLAHKECVEASHLIIDEIDRGSRQSSSIHQAIWTIPYHGIAAAIVLALDMIRLKFSLGHSLDSSDPHDPHDPRNNKQGDERNVKEKEEEMNTRRKGVEKARIALERLAPTSRIARRGLQVLADLEREGQNMVEMQQMKVHQGQYILRDRREGGERGAENIGSGSRDVVRGKKEEDEWRRKRRSSESMAKIVKKIKLPSNEMMEGISHSPSSTTITTIAQTPLITHQSLSVSPSQHQHWRNTSPRDLTRQATIQTQTHFPPSNSGYPLNSQQSTYPIPPLDQINYNNNDNYTYMPPPPTGRIDPPISQPTINNLPQYDPIYTNDFEEYNYTAGFNDQTALNPGGGNLFDLFGQDINNASSSSSSATTAATNQLIMSLQQSIPDISRLFDGSIGSFGYQ